jgi:hypothetical protein
MCHAYAVRSQIGVFLGVACALPCPHTVAPHGWIVPLRGIVTWYHPELQTALIERAGGFTVGTIVGGRLSLGDELIGQFTHEATTKLLNATTGEPVLFLVEANALSEEQANELLGFMRD